MNYYGLRKKVGVKTRIRSTCTCFPQMQLKMIKDIISDLSQNAGLID